MSGDRGFSFPITAISVAALLVSGTYLAPHALEALRVTESDAVKVRLADPPVEARLWEDPLAALVRHRAKLREGCPDGTKGAAARDPRCTDGKWGADALPKELWANDADVTLIAALLPGTGFVGVEESRRRLRHALLAGLGAREFVPDDSEGMRLLSICQAFNPCKSEPDPAKTPTEPPAPAAPSVSFRSARVEVVVSLHGRIPTTTDAPAAGTASPQGREATVKSKTHAFDIAFETLSAGGQGRPRHAVVLWIDDTKFGRQWLSRLAGLLDAVSSPGGSNVRLRVVGPFSSDKLVDALADDYGSISAEQRSALANLQLISPYSTASAEQLRSAAAKRLTAASLSVDVTEPFASCAGGAVDCIDEAFKERLGTVGQVRLGPVPDESILAEPFFVRTIGRDLRQIDLLVKELRARGVDGRESHRVVLLREWDSIYARKFAEDLKVRLAEETEGKIELEIHSYLRGLDGATADGAPKLQRLVPRGDKDRDDRKARVEVEWPESRDQRDYVRRLVAEIEEGPRRDDRTKAKGKVMAVGMIGADVHDKLILAQALRAAFPDRVLFTTDLDARFMHPEVLGYTRNLIVASSLSLVPDPVPTVGIAPFREAYQTAVYRAAYYAVGSPSAAPPEPRGRLFEIGGDGAVELDMDEKVSKPESERRLRYALVALGALAVLGWVMLFGKPAPAMKTALSRDEEVDEVPNGPSTGLLSGLQAAAWGFALGVVVELGWPGTVGLFRALVLAAALALAFWSVVYLMRRVGRTAGWYVAALVGLVPLILIAALASWAWTLLPPLDPTGAREPLAPGSGISTWPSQLLRTLGVVLFAWFLDFAWNGSTAAARTIDRSYFAAGPRSAPFTFWRLNPGKEPHEIGGDGLWLSYRGVLGNWPRLLRMVLWFGAVFVVLAGEGAMLGGETPELPARGVDDRRLFLITTYLLVFGTVFLLMLVADTTVHTWRIVAILKKGRTVYPGSTVSSYWTRLGLRPLQPQVQARVEDRGGSSGAPERNSLLDDWIDARLLAAHTEKIGPLIFYPFVLIALLIVARSRRLDNWAPGGFVMVALATYLLWAVAMAAMLNIIAEIARREAVDNMRADLRWMEGRGKPYEKVIGPFKGVIDDVVNLRQGAFAPFFEQPLVRAILVALGGAGGIQLLEMVVFGR
ncbi:hypothetical protein [Reyranella sp.]|uniref:hypothetical protein n=1 Tax=Reyranella sp. TaxID=1929291 RepID=UPI003BAB6A9B